MRILTRMPGCVRRHNAAGISTINLSFYAALNSSLQDVNGMWGSGGLQLGWQIFGEQIYKNSHTL